MRTTGAVIGGVAAGILYMVEVAGAATAGLGLAVTGWTRVFTELIPSAWQWGVDSVTGLIDGITSGMGLLWEAAKGMGSTVKEGLSSVLRFGSPSKVMKQYGRWTGEGMQIGMDQTMPSSIPGIPSRANVSGAASRLGKTGASSISIGDTIINVSGSSDPEQTAQATLRAFERNLGSVLGQMTGEAAA